MKNAKQINWKVFGTEKSLIHLMSMGLVGHEACRRCSFSKDISNNDRRARRQCLDSAKEISKILLYGAMRNSPRNHSGRIRFYLNSIKTQLSDKSKSFKTAINSAKRMSWCPKKEPKQLIPVLDNQVTPLAADILRLLEKNYLHLTSSP